MLKLFGQCSHQRETWPIRLAGQTVAHRTCLDCGRTRSYALLDTWAIAAKKVQNQPPEARRTVEVGARVLQAIRALQQQRQAPVTLSQVLLAFGRSSFPNNAVPQDPMTLATHGRSVTP